MVAALVVEVYAAKAIAGTASGPAIATAASHARSRVSLDPRLNPKLVTV